MSAGLTTKLRGVVTAVVGFRRKGEAEEAKEDADAEADLVLDSSTASKRPMFAITNGYSNYHVRLKDIKAYITKRAIKRKRRLGFQLEALYLFFFIPFCIYWMASLDQLRGALGTLALKPFPTNPIPPFESAREAEFTTFETNILSEGEFWQWVNNVLYDEFFVNGQCGLSLNSDPNVITAGLIRIRQLRVSSRPCPQTASLLNLACYPAYSDSAESSRPISPKFPYSTSAATDEMEYYGEMARYPGSGFTLDLQTGTPPGVPCNASALNQTMELLQARATPFLDASTRAVIVTLTTFSPNTGALVTSRLAVEVSYGGAFQTSSQNSGVIFYRSSSSQLTMQVLTVFVAILESVFILCTAYNLIIALRWADSWTWTTMDIASCALMVLQLVIVIQFFFTPTYTSRFTESINNPTDGAWPGAGFYSGSDLGTLAQVAPVNGALLLLSAMRLFKYSQYFDAMEVIHGTFRRTLNDILLYLFLLFLLSLGYVLCSVVVLGYSLEQYRNYGKAVYTLLQFYILTMDYYSVARVKPFGLYFAPLFLASFLLIFTWYMFSVFVAIIYVGFRLERTTLLKQSKEMTKWTREAEKCGASCPLETDILRGNIVLEETEDNAKEPTAEDSSKVASGEFGGILLRKNFYFRSWNERILEFVRQAFGLSDRPGFLDYDAILLLLEDYEQHLRQSLMTPSKRFFVTFAELLDIFNGRSLDLLEELRRTQNDAAAAEEYKRLRQGKVSEVDRWRLQEQVELSADSDAYMKKMDPLELQLTRIFRSLWIVPEDKVDFLARQEADDTGGLIKRSLLVRIQQTLQNMDERETESSRIIINKIKSMRVVQQTMERDVRTMREILK